MQQNRVEPRPLIVVATTLPFFARAATIVQETWRELDRMAAVLDQCAVAGASASRCAKLGVAFAAFPLAIDERMR